MRNTKYGRYFENFKPDEAAEKQIRTALKSGDLSWPFGVTRKFEEEISRFLDVKFALAHCNGTSAMYSAMFAVGVGEGTEVICPTYTFWASISPAINLGARVVFCDINKDDLLVDVDSIEKYFSAKTRAIVVPHLWGRFCDIRKLKRICNRYKHKIYIIEDASHCFGAKYRNDFLGTLGDVGIFSLQAGKPLIAGEGGMLVTNNFDIYDRAIYLGHYERIRFLQGTNYAEYSKTGGGYKFRIHPFASALALSQLKGITKKLQRHNTLMSYYEDELEKMPQVRICKKSYEGFTYGGRFGLRIAVKMSHEKKVEFINECGAKGLAIEDEYIPLLHKERFFLEHAWNDQKANMFRETQDVYENLLSLPIFYTGDRSVIDHYLGDFSKIIKKYIH